MSTWYYTDAEQQRQGPLSTDELKQYFRREAILDDTLVWRDGMLHWRPLGELAVQLGLREAAEAVAADASALSLAPRTPPLPPSPPPPAAPPAPKPVANVAQAPASGRAVFNLGSEPAGQPPFALDEARPHAVPGLAAGEESNPYRPSLAPLRTYSARVRDEDVVYAGFWKRAAAVIVDSIIIGIAGGLGGEALGTLLGDLTGGGELAVVLLTMLITFILQACYFAFFHSAFSLATPGKMIVGIKVVRGNGEPISFWRGVARYFATIPSTLILCIGYLMAAFTDRKRALHDMICDTVVVDKWAFSPQPEMQREELGTAAVVILAGYALLILLAVIFVVAVGFGALGRAG
ncbi:MAG TPA: RDD family protein [Pseudoxanthomonas sp.]